MKPIEQLKNTIKSTIRIPEQILNEFVSCWELIEYEKGTIITTAGNTDRYLHYTVEGVQKAYYIGEEKQNIISFTQPNQFTCAPESFLTQTPSKYYFECITQSVFYRVPYNNFIEHMNKHKVLQEYLVKSLMGLVNNITDRFIKQATLSIEEKFKDFMKRNAHLLNKIPHKEIANYLSINPTNFSKLLNNVIIE